MSDQYDSSTGMVYMGEYTVRVTFHFLVDGKPTPLTTAVFQITV
jgi:hypothetical protein